MTSSKAWGDDRDATEPAATGERRIRASGIAVAGLLILAALGAGWIASRLWSADPAKRLEEARTILANDRNLPGLQRAADLTEAYLHSGAAAERDAALLLRCVALARLGHNNLDRPAAEASEIEQRLTEVSAGNCSPADLWLAIAAFRDTGRLGQADWLIGWALQQNKPIRELLVTAAEIRYDLGREAEAMAHCQQLIAMDPRDAQAWRMIALMHADSGFAEKQLDALNHLIPLLPPPAVDERLQRLTCLIAIGDAPRAREEFAALQQVAPQRLKADSLIEAGLLILEGRAADALPLVEAARTTAPEAAEPMLLHGRILLALNRIDEAVPILSRLAEIDPTNNEAHYLLGQTLARRGETEVAQKHLDQHRLLLDLRVKIHRLERVAGKDPTDVETRRELVTLYERLGLPEQARFWRRAAESASQ